MSVKLISISQPVDKNLTSAEALVAYCARVSNPANQDNPNSEKLLKYLVDHSHWSPFEMVSLTLEIKTSRSIARQILRHRSFSFQEFSQRYSNKWVPSELSEVRLQDEKNRQNSISVNNKELSDWWNTTQIDTVMIAIKMYEEAINKGIAKEVARNVLPEGLTQSTMYMAGTLRSWIHYCQLRTGNGTQLEHQQIARECWKIISEQFPSISGLINID